MTDVKFPILSICIPTYNRADLLNDLLGQLNDFRHEIGVDVEVCISDNASTDDTQEIISRWGLTLPLRTIRQEKNIGGSRNFQEVSALATAPWMLLMGDDDLFLLPGLKRLLELLRTKESNSWVFANVQNEDGTVLLEADDRMDYSRDVFNRDIILSSLFDGLGFMSVHVIPLRLAHSFRSLELSQIYAWPHLALLFREMPRVKLSLQAEPIVLRGGGRGEVTQTWRALDWLLVLMQKTKVCAFEGGSFSNALAIREYFRWSFARQVLSVIMGGVAGQQVFVEACRYIEATNIWSITKFAIKIYLYFVTNIPIDFVVFVRCVIRRGRKNATNFVRDGGRVTDGVDRGL